MSTKSTSSDSRVAFTFAEFADKVGRHRTWVYRQVKAGRIKAIIGYGTAMIPTVEIERVFGRGA